MIFNSDLSARGLRARARGHRERDTLRPRRPEECSHDEFLASIWPSDPLSRKIAGEPEDIRRITRDGLYAFYRAEFSPSRLLITAAGPIPPSDVAEELRRLLDDLPAGPEGAAESAGATRAETTPAFSRTSGYRKRDMEQVHFYEAIQLDPPFTENDYYALSALNGALGEASSSRLFLSLREDKGLCYSVYSAFAMSGPSASGWRRPTCPLPSCPSSPPKWIGSSTKAAEDGIGGRECADAVSRLAGSFDLALDDTDFRMRRIARQACSSPARPTTWTRLERMARSGSEDNAICERLLKGRARARFAYGGLSRRTPRRAAS
jgi:hypothetical protein